MKFWCSNWGVHTTEVVAVAKMLDEAGYHGFFLPDHLMYPKDLASPYPYSPHEDGRPIWEPDAHWPDSWVLIGAMAAVTERLHFSNNVYIAPARPLAVVAKQVATAAVLSDNRVSLGMAPGWMREEFELLGQNFDDRGPRTSEMIEALRALWQGGWVEFHGEYYDVPEATFEPAPTAPIPIWVGGVSKPAIRRAGKHADGWIGNGGTVDVVAEQITAIRTELEKNGRSDEGFRFVAPLYAMPSIDMYEDAAAVGVTDTLAMPWMGPDGPDAGPPDERLDRYKASIDAFAERFVKPLADE